MDTRARVLPRFEHRRILAIETGGCPHAAIREDISANLGACETLTARHQTDIVLVESGGGACDDSFLFRKEIGPAVRSVLRQAQLATAQLLRTHDVGNRAFFAAFSAPPRVRLFKMWFRTALHDFVLDPLFFLIQARHAHLPTSPFLQAAWVRFKTPP